MTEKTKKQLIQEVENLNHVVELLQDKKNVTDGHFYAFGPGHSDKFVKENMDLFTDECVHIVKENKHLVNSEGARIFSSFVRYLIDMRFSAIDNRNKVIIHEHRFADVDLSTIPSYDELMKVGEETKKDLFEIIKAPIQGNGVYVVLMDQENHGILWHEIGHALEAHRLQKRTKMEEKSTIFINKIGKKVAPCFISLYDDPTIETMDGHFLFDDEGVKAQRTELIKNGILKTFLHCRESAGYSQTQSNGHARAAIGQTPVARMANLIVESSNAVSYEQLKENLIKECERKNDEYGLIFKICGGGITLPTECHFETYPSKVYRLYRNGKEELRRGVYDLGTSHQIISNILQTSNEYRISHGSCGAESGYIPAAEKAPHALISSLEINEIPENKYEEMKDLAIPKFKIK